MEGRKYHDSPTNSRLTDSTASRMLTTYLCSSLRGLWSSQGASGQTTHWAEAPDKQGHKMPTKPGKYCAISSCNKTVSNGSTRCIDHYQAVDPTYDTRRGNANERGYTKRWSRARRVFLNEHPLCKLCHDAGILRPATVVDHIIPHKGDMALFWNRDNWMALCATCHNKKTATEDGGFGRKPTGRTQDDTVDSGTLSTLKRP